MGFTVDIQCIEPADYGQKAQLALASGEKIDIIWTGNWGGFDYEQNVSKNAFLALDEYLEIHEFAELKNYYSEGIWEATKIGGKIYGVPIEQVLYDQPGVTFMKEYVEKYNLLDAVNACSSMDELEEIYTTVRNGEPSDFIITLDTTQHYRPYYSKVNNYEIKDGKVFIDTDAGLEASVRNRRWNQLGYFPGDVATNSDKTALSNAGKLFSDYGRYLPGSEGKATLSKGYEVVHRPSGDAVLSRKGIQSTLFGIAATSQNPVRALKFVNLMLHDQYMLNLICYGIEGRDYNKDPENPKRMTRVSEYYISEYLVGSQFLAYLVPSYEDGVWEETKAANENAKVDELIGFSFDPKSVESEISQVSAAGAEYGKILNYGLDADPEAVYEEKEKKLELAGRQVIVDEINRQLEEWMAQQ